ncbi:MAG: MBG domain-containing protein, partial [Christensenellales bacterium]
IADCITKTFGDLDPELTYKFYETSLVEGDTLSGTITRVEGENVGSYSISKGTLNNNNYEILFLNGTLKILPKDISIEIDDIVTTYGEEKPLTFTSLETIDLNNLTGSLSRTGNNNVGVYSISLGTLSSTNYNINVTKYGSYTIKPKTITVTALPSEKTYGDNDNIEFKVDGLCEGDTLYGELSRNAGENVGKYEINLGTLNNSNYTLNFVSNYLNILPAKLIITISDLSQVYGEMDKEFEYILSGVKFDDNISCEIYREAGDNVGEYLINCSGIDNDNYVIERVNTGIYSITKATIIPTITRTTFTYSGNVNYVSANFPFELTFVYKQNGIECEGMLNAGVYQVQAIFAGNENYKESKSQITDVIIEKQKVYLTLAENKFIYDGTVKFPEFYYNANCGLDINKISFEFENDIRPLGVGSYNFNIVTTDTNYDVNTSGVLLIANPLSITNSNESIIECVDATFDENSQDLMLIEKSLNGQFNDKEIISSCSFANVSQDDDHIYTIKIKANSNAKTVYVYQLGENNSVREIAVTNENGYYIFKVDNLTDTYLITKDIEPLPLWFWLAIVGGVVIALIVTLQIIKHSKKVKLAKKNNTDIETYNMN